MLNKFRLKYYSFLSLLIALIPFTSFSQIETCKHLEHSLAIHKLAKNNSNNATVNITYHQLKVIINPDIRYISGSVKTIFNISEPISELIFNLNNALTVDSVLRNNQKLDFLHQNNLLTIAINSHSEDSVTVFYKGEPATSGFGSFVQDTHSGKNIIWTLSEPFGAPEWWPCVESFSDKIDSLDMQITIPKGNKAAGIGVLKNIADNGTSDTYFWQHRYPIAFYLVALAVTNYEEYTEWCVIEGDSMPILNYVYPETLLQAQNQTSVTTDLIKFYSQFLGKYPFWNEKYGHAQFGRNGGMEHQTMSFMGNFSFNLNAHELAHQWFGNKITCNGWDEIWINESFATYLNGMAIEKFQGFEAFNAWKKSLINEIIKKPNGSVYVYDSTNFNAIFDSRLTYLKGAMVLHLLRIKMGDFQFKKACLAFLNNENCSYKYASTTDFINSFAPFCPFDLSEFVNKWIYGEGFPILDISWTQYQDKNFNINVKQRCSNLSNTIYDFPLRVILNGFSFSSYLFIDINSSEQESGTPSLDYFVESIEIDPLFDIIFVTEKLEQNHVQREVLVLYPNPAENYISVFCDDPSCSIEQIEIYNLLGENSLVVTQKGRKINIDVEKLAKGIYFLKIATNTGNYIRKISISK